MRNILTSILIFLSVASFGQSDSIELKMFHGMIDISIAEQRFKLIDNEDKHIIEQGDLIFKTIDFEHSLNRIPNYADSTAQIIISRTLSSYSEKNMYSLNSDFYRIVLFEEDSVIVFKLLDPLSNATAFTMIGDSKVGCKSQIKKANNILLSKTELNSLNNQFKIINSNNTFLNCDDCLSLYYPMIFESSINGIYHIWFINPCMAKEKRGKEMRDFERMHRFVMDIANNNQ